MGHTSRFLRVPVEPFELAPNLSADDVLARMEHATGKVGVETSDRVVMLSGWLATSGQVSRVGREAGHLSPENVAETLGLEVFATIPEDGQTISAAVNLGERHLADALVSLVVAVDRDREPVEPAREQPLRHRLVEQRGVGLRAENRRQQLGNLHAVQSGEVEVREPSVVYVR